MTDACSRQQVQRVAAAATTLRAIADCLVEQAQPPAAFGGALDAVSQELAALSREVSRCSPSAPAPRNANGRGLGGVSR